MTLERAQHCARLTILMVLACLHEKCVVDRISRCARLIVYLRASESFTQHPKIANGASDILRDLFGTESPDLHRPIGRSWRASRFGISSGDLPRLRCTTPATAARCVANGDVTATPRDYVSALRFFRVGYFASRRNGCPALRPTCSAPTIPRQTTPAHPSSNFARTWPDESISSRLSFFSRSSRKRASRRRRSASIWRLPP